MSTNTNTDLTEEDAADLQFPKDKRKRYEDNMKYLQVNVSTKCTNCNNHLPSVYVLCEECDLNLCTRCFADGVEFSKHKNDHDYRIMNDRFILFENSKWTARDELTLLNGLLRLGNWTSISKMLPNYNMKEIKDHYEQFYIHRKGSDLLPEFPNISRGTFIEPIVPYRFKTTNIMEPPRMPLNVTSGSYLSGYNAARSDFELEYDTSAEDLLCKLEVPYVDNPNYELIVDMQYAIFKIYNKRLEERARRKRIIRRHGLIVPRKVTAWLHRYDTTITPNVYEKLIRFMRYCSGEQFEYVMEGLHKAGELKMQIARLCEFRRKGITTLAGANLYLSLSSTNEEQTRNYRNFQNNPYFKLESKDVTIFQKKNRCEFRPINIVGMPGYEMLDDKERELCTNIRLVPISYLEFKELLIQENNKHGSLKLAMARRQLKIDVNKTRRLYDFLAQEGYITKPN